MRRRAWLALALLLAACSRTGGEAGEVTIAAAASLRGKCAGT